jgi:hypothetical protein
LPPVAGHYGYRAAPGIGPHLSAARRIRRSQRVGCASSGAMIGPVPEVLGSKHRPGYRYVRFGKRGRDTRMAGSSERGNGLLRSALAGLGRIQAVDSSHCDSGGNTQWNSGWYILIDPPVGLRESRSAASMTAALTSSGVGRRRWARRSCV